MGSPFTPKPRALTAADVAKKIEGFLESSGERQDWSEFCTSRIADPALDAIRKHCAHLPEEFPPASPERYCGAGGYSVLRGYLRKLRGEKPSLAAPTTAAGPAGSGAPRATSADPNEKDAIKLTGSDKDRVISVQNVVERKEQSQIVSEDALPGTVFRATGERPAGYPPDLPFIPDLDVLVTERSKGSRAQHWKVDRMEPVREAILRACLEEGWERVLRPAVPDAMQKLMNLVFLRRGDRWRYVTATALDAGSVVKLVDVPAGTLWSTALEIR